MGIAKTRKLAFEIIYAVCEEGAKSHLRLADTFAARKDLTVRDRAVITNLVHGTLDNLRLIDYRIDEVAKLPAGKMKPKVRCAVRLGFYQLLFLDRTSESAAIRDSVELVRKAGYEGLTGFVNGVLRTAAKKTDWKKPPAVVAANLPDWLHARLLQEFGKRRTRDMIRALNGRSPLTLRVNRSKATPENVIRFLAEDGWQAEPAELPGALRLTRGETAVPLEKTAVISAGLAVVQDLAAILSVALAAPKPGDAVLDLCAAPGGKSMHAADLAGPEGSVLACDLTENKIRLLEENITRCGFENMRAQIADARVFDPKKEEKYDLVIADLPCSGLGVMGRKPEIRYRVSEEEIRELAALQREILENAVRYVKPGGNLLFSTCTMTEEENRANALWLMNEAALKPADIQEAVPEAFRDGMIGTNCLQLLPSALSDGFFISIWEKSNE